MYKKISRKKGFKKNNQKWLSGIGLKLAVEKIKANLQLLNL